MSSSYGKLYVVATPIGNLADFSYRGVEILKQVDLIAAEDTRHIRLLLQHYGINNKLLALHQHNEHKISPQLIEKLCQGQNIALVSDAGTPLLSDPGMPLVAAAKNAGIDVSPIPGACALIAALSVAGLPVSQFCFAGFLPRTHGARKAYFKQQQDNASTWVFYESCHRIRDAIQDLAEVLPGERQMVIAREISKLHETIVKTTVAEAPHLFEENAYMQRGEFVVIVKAAELKPADMNQLSKEQENVLAILLKECSIKSAVAMAVEITQARKKTLYQAALRMRAVNDK